MKPTNSKRFLVVLCWFCLFSVGILAQSKPPIINDVTQLNPIQVSSVIEPLTQNEIIESVKNHPGPISIGGGRYSMGGQTATENALQIDMRKYDKIVSFSIENKEITVQAGITWRKLQEFIDVHNLSVLIKQTYSNFTVGGSLSVNVHGRYIGLGPIIMSVKSFTIVLPDGTSILASPDKNKEIFYGAIGGYGALGVISEVTLFLTENCKVERSSIVMPVAEYKDYFLSKIREDSNVVFHNADIHPSSYTNLRAISYTKTDKNLTVDDRLVPADKDYWMEKMAYWAITEIPFRNWVRENIIEPWFFGGECVEWRNYEASYDVKELEPSSRLATTYVLQEYFIPIENIGLFIPKMAEIFQRYDVNVVNVSIRHAKKDPGSLLSWARNEVFAFVVYYKQGTSDKEKNDVAVWTRELIGESIKLDGAYYLPYQIQATDKQFKAAYPNCSTFFALKKRIDPGNKFRNKLWDAYYHPEAKDSTVSFYTSRIKEIMGNKEGSDGIYKFLQNVYGLYPANDYHFLIKQTAAKYDTDKEIYKYIQKDLPEITPAFWSLRYALPALSIQKKEIARQTAQLLPGTKNINGYLEIGTTGRYVHALQDHFKMEGPVYLSYYEQPGYGAQEIAERGQLFKIGQFFDLDHYNPISRSTIPDESLDLITVYIGLHHAPKDKLDGYVKSLWRVLRPGGKLIIRDHNSKDAEFSKFVSVIHDIFYCGLGESWEYTNGEIRNFTSTDSLSAYLKNRGFLSDNTSLLQKNDPSLNTLKVFTKTTMDNVEVNANIELGKMIGYKRDVAQTYLTVPEWYLVFNPAEYAAFIKSHPPSAYPYFGSIAEFWSYYEKVIVMTKDYPINWGYHFMIVVIGTSFTVENVIKGVWENTLGRIAEVSKSGGMTQEETLAATVAKEYEEFIRIYPWYEFPFYDMFKKVWTQTDYWGNDTFRKWERKLFLSLEYGGKAFYAWLIKLGTKSVYGDAEEEILAWISAPNPDKVTKKLQLKVVKKFQDSSFLVALPRYEKFKDVVAALANNQVHFLEIAGNDHILMTVVIPQSSKFHFPNCKFLFQKPILTDSSYKRIALELPVKNMHLALSEMSLNKIEAEHIYDF